MPSKSVHGHESENRLVGIDQTTPRKDDPETIRQECKDREDRNEPLDKSSGYYACTGIVIRGVHEFPPAAGLLKTATDPTAPDYTDDRPTKEKETPSLGDLSVYRVVRLARSSHA
jgi:hypothetical protein